MATYYIDYQAYDQRDPQTGERNLRCGRIVNRRLLEGKNLAEALQKKGVASMMTLEEFNGLMNAINAKKRELVLEGYRVKDDYITVGLTMNGQLGVNDSIGPNTKVSIKIDPRDDMKIGEGDKLSFHNVDKIAAVTIDSVGTVGGKIGEWQKERQANAVGKGLDYNSKIGDKITWEADGLSGECEVDSSGENTMTLPWDSDWDAFAAGTEIKLTFTLHGGVAEATPKTITKTVKVVIA